ncbi:MAG: hypothetical protein JZU50_05245 [Desulfobulbaceae bacterium]|jgi:hypothetical protein|nr:hypothetical protein [Desulfobulbaceae bacterium]
MKIHFKKKEYRLLLDFLYIAEWVINSREIDDNPETKPYKDLEQKIMSAAKDFGFENLITYDKKFEEFLPTVEFEEDPTVNNFIDKYVAETFWDELCDRLAKRDFLAEHDAETIEKMDESEIFVKTSEYSDRYHEEFVKNGLNNIKIDK